MAISAVELLAGVAWLVGMCAVVWALRAGRLAGSETVLLLLLLTLVPLLGPMAVALLVGMRTRPTRANGSTSP